MLRKKGVQRHIRIWRECKPTRQSVDVKLLRRGSCDPPVFVYAAVFSINYATAKASRIFVFLMFRFAEICLAVAFDNPA